MKDYNHNNTVISESTLRFSSDILRRLGEELNPNPSDGLIELVKNSYDADALECSIELINTDAPGGAIIISDDGNGMGEDDIKNGWLVLGRSPKVNQNLTHLGRLPSGDKGLGRLAALRMGTHATLTSVPRKDQTQGYRLTIDWNRYDQTALIDQVELQITKENYSEPKPHGIKISVEDLKLPINRVDVRKLARSMILLADPFGDNPVGFEPRLKGSEYKDLEELVGTRYFGDAEFKLVASIDDQGFANAAVFDWRGEALYNAEHTDIRPKAKNSPYNCLPVTFTLWVFVLDSKTFSTRTNKIGEVRDWLNAFGGVHLYYNGLRVSPYGDEGDDWLGLNLMRVRSPEVRPSTNTVIGRITINDTSNIFIQKTDRSGFIENEPFLQLRQFASDVLNWMARKRLADAETKRTKQKEKVAKETTKEKLLVEDAISKAPEKSRDDIDAAFVKYNEARDAEVGQLRKEVQLYRTLSTVGITSSVFAHESANNPIKIIEQSIKTIGRRAQEILNDWYDVNFKAAVERILHSVDSLKVLTKVTLSLVDHEKRRVSRVDIHDVIKTIINLYEPFTTDRQVKISLELAEARPFLRGSVAAIESILSNLINNSLIAFESAPVGERLIIIRTNITDEWLELRILDNGPGIVDIDKSDIWLPGETTRKNGTGLGLTIVKDTVGDLGGSVDAIEKGELGGAEIIIELPIIGVDK